MAAAVGAGLAAAAEAGLVAGGVDAAAGGERESASSASRLGGGGGAHIAWSARAKPMFGTTFSSQSPRPLRSWLMGFQRSTIERLSLFIPKIRPPLMYVVPFTVAAA